MSQQWSPNDIEVLIHYHASAAKHPRVDAPAVRDAIAMWEHLGCLQVDNTFDSGYRTTDRGRAMLATWCSAELPKPAWVDAQGKIIDIN